MRATNRLKPRIVLQNHLQQIAVDHDLKPLRRVHPLRKKQTQPTARRKQAPHRRESLQIRLREPTQRRNFRRKPPQYAVSLSKIRLASPQRIENRIIERVHPGAPKRRKTCRRRHYCRCSPPDLRLRPNPPAIRYLRPNWTVTEQQTKHRIPTGAHTSKAFQKLSCSIEFPLIRRRGAVCASRLLLSGRENKLTPAVRPG